MLSNTAVPIYYGAFRDKVIRGEIPVCKEIEQEMNRIDDLIRNPGVYYDPEGIEGFIRFCENELTLTDGSDLFLLDSFGMSLFSSMISIIAGITAARTGITGITQSIRQYA